jgi:hypothetical protein
MKIKNPENLRQKKTGLFWPVSIFVVISLKKLLVGIISKFMIGSFIILHGDISS